MLKTKNYKFWFCTGSQDLYGDECLEHVAEHAKIIVAKLNESGVLPYEVIWKPGSILTLEKRSIHTDRSKYLRPMSFCGILEILKHL